MSYLGVTNKHIKLLCVFALLNEERISRSAARTKKSGYDLLNPFISAVQRIHEHKAISNHFYYKRYFHEKMNL